MKILYEFSFEPTTNIIFLLTINNLPHQQIFNLFSILFIYFLFLVSVGLHQIYFYELDISRLKPIV